MQENKLFETLLDVIPFAAYAVDVETYEVVYANKMMSEKLYAPREEFCWSKVYGQEEACSWCTIPTLKQRGKVLKSEKIVTSFFDESNDSWIQSYDELVRWPDGRTVKYSIEVDITEQKEIQASMIQTHTKLAMQSKKLKEANEKLEFLATKDFLTKVNNRGNFFALTNAVWNKPLENDKKLFVAMLDIDKFKNINDTYGHSLGDDALVAFADAVSHLLDSDDIFGRLGGEEFALLIVSEYEEFAMQKLEKIRVAVENISLHQNDKEVKFTVSIGLARKERDESLDVCLDRADQQLYDAKTTGRNKIKFRGF